MRSPWRSPWFEADDIGGIPLELLQNHVIALPAAVLVVLGQSEGATALEVGRDVPVIGFMQQPHGGDDVLSGMRIPDDNGLERGVGDGGEPPARGVLTVDARSQVIGALDARQGGPLPWSLTAVPEPEASLQSLAWPVEHRQRTRMIGINTRLHLPAQISTWR